MNDVAIMSNNVFNNDHIRIEENEGGLDFNKSNILYCNDDCTRITGEVKSNENKDLEEDVEEEDVEEEDVEEEEDKDVEGEGE